MMGQIHRHASCVLAWVSPSFAGSAALVNDIRSSEDIHPNKQWSQLEALSIEEIQEQRKQKLTAILPALQHFAGFTF
jgi:hypothetical protein